ncbi:MAG: nitronate monooxygenase, partial [Actinobacteria bacterium]|nr:nitronate monooxygenase [Actinomycetota bacterium]
MTLLDGLRLPIVQAPMAGGPSTPALALAVSEAGGLGFLAGGYRSAGALGDEIRAMRRETDRPFGVNIFVPGSSRIDEAALRGYLASIEPDAARHGVEVGPARLDDDDWAAKLAVLHDDPPPVASFTFGCPPPGVVATLRDRGVTVWATVTSPEDAGIAARAGVDALVVQGAEAGGHQASFVDDDRDPLGLLALLQLIGAAVSLPLVATGGIATGAAVAAVLAAGASAAQIGSALMLTTEAATHPAHRAALASPAATGLTRSFTGRRARGIRNRFQDAHSDAPSA